MNKDVFASLNRSEQLGSSCAGTELWETTEIEQRWRKFTPILAIFLTRIHKYEVDACEQLIPQQ